MTAQIVGTEIKLIWRLFVYYYNPVNVANTILHRMQVSLVWVRAKSISPRVVSQTYIYTHVVDIMKIHTGYVFKSMHWQPALPFCNTQCCRPPV